MGIEALKVFSSRLELDNHSVFYQGEFHDDFTEKLIGLSEYNINNYTGLSKTRKKVSFLMAECFQNIVRHGNSTNEEMPSYQNKAGCFFTRNLGDRFYITSVNLVQNDLIEGLSSKLEQVNGLNKEELKKHYLDLLIEGELSQKGGAGLGLIEMARRSGHPLKYAFSKIDDRHSFFYLQISMKSKGSDEPTTNHNASINDAKAFHQNMMDNNTLLLYKGDFSSDSILPVLKMVEDNLVNHGLDFKQKKRIYIALVEILQNISKHSKSDKNLQEGYFMISKEGNQFSINTGNPILTTDLGELRNYIDHINGLTSTELKRLRKEILLDHPDPERGLGLIEVARDINAPISYSFKEDSETTSFFTMNILI